MSKELVLACGEFERQFMHQQDDSIRSTGYYALHPTFALYNLSYLEGAGRIKKGMKFLDLGSGLGHNVAIANHLGMEAYGIEVHKPLFEGSEQLLTDLHNRKLIDLNGIKVALGNYFPPSYIDHRNAGWSHAEKFEKTVGDLVSKGNKRGLNTLHLSKGDDVYKELGVNVGDIDVFYSYTWGQELPAQLEMFSLYAKQGAMLLNFSTHLPETMKPLLDKLGLQMEKNQLFDPSHAAWQSYSMNIFTKRKRKLFKGKKK